MAPKSPPQPTSRHPSSRAKNRTKQARRRWKPVLLIALAAAGLLWGGWKWSEARHYRKALAHIDELMEGGFHSLAVKELTTLLDRYSSSDELTFLLGKCERLRGRTEAAAEAWARVPPRSPLAFHALEGRMQLELERRPAHRRRAAHQESVVKTRAHQPGPEHLARPHLLPGRTGQRGNAVDRGALASPRASRATPCIRNRHQSTSVVHPDSIATRSRMKRSAPCSTEPVEVAPDDDRIWLWKANLAIRTKSYEEAARWIDLCL